MLLLLQFAIATATDKLGKKNPLLNAKLLITYPRFPWLCIVFFQSKKFQSRVPVLYMFTQTYECYMNTAD